MQRWHLQMRGTSDPDGLGRHLRRQGADRRYPARQRSASSQRDRPPPGSGAQDLFKSNRMPLTRVVSASISLSAGGVSFGTRALACDYSRMQPCPERAPRPSPWTPRNCLTGRIRWSPRRRMRPTNSLRPPRRFGWTSMRRARLRTSTPYSPRTEPTRSRGPTRARAQRRRLSERTIRSATRLACMRDGRREGSAESRCRRHLCRRSPGPGLAGGRSRPHRSDQRGRDSRELEHWRACGGNQPAGAVAERSGCVASIAGHAGATGGARDWCSQARSPSGRLRGSLHSSADRAVEAPRRPRKRHPGTGAGRCE